MTVSSELFQQCPFQIIHAITSNKIPCSMPSIELLAPYTLASGLDDSMTSFASLPPLEGLMLHPFSSHESL